MACGDEATTNDATSNLARARRIGIVSDPRFLGHDPGPGHPESPRRLDIAYGTIADIGTRVPLVRIEPRVATADELRWNHEAAYVARVRDAASHGPIALDADTVVSPRSWEAAILAVGGVFAALDAMSSGTIDVALALVRPPGHHAEADRAMGFCLFNNVALGAHYARRVLGHDRVMIVDWDLHHGNGTQRSFLLDPAVLFCSVHQFPYYPGTGSLGEVGTGRGEGYTVNIPLRAGSDDETYAAAFNQVILPVGRAYRPQIILVSAGFDIHWDDPLGGMEVTGNGFAYMTRCLLDLADDYSAGRVLFCLEGGYSPRGLHEGLCALVGECAEASTASAEELAALRSIRHPALDLIAEFHQRHWPTIFP